MVDLAYIFFVCAATVLGGFLGFVSHFARSNLSGPEKLFSDDDLMSDVLNNSLGDRNYIFEKHVVNAKWDDGGYWDELSNRNLIYMVLGGVLPPLILGAMLWPYREHIVIATCSGLAHIGLHSPLCS